MKKRLPAWVVVCALFLLGCEQKAALVVLNGQTMGTYYSVKYVDKADLPSQKAIQQQIEAHLQDVNQKMSTYLPESQLSQFNRHREASAFSVSPHTALVVKEAQRLHELSDGALDVTMGPLVNLWGFGPDARPERVPSTQLIAQTRAKTGMQFLQLAGTQLSKTHPELYVDLSSIAKGFAVDLLADYLATVGVENYLVDIGGELKLKGVNDRARAWRIAIEKPVAGERSVQQIIAPQDLAVATSGDYRNYFEQDGLRYSHTIDPATGNPITHHLVSATVLDKSCMTADGLATAFMVLGPERALALAEKEAIALFLIVKTQNGFEERVSSAFKPYLISQ
ncbi:MAG: FAD:protein FMN transferase [Vibrionaceae bacterium]